MDRKEARDFLRARQPMPSDLDLGMEELDNYIRVLDFLEENPDEECLRLLVFSLPPDANGLIAQGVPAALRALPGERALEMLGEALASPEQGVRMRAAEWSLEFADEKLLEPLAGVLKDPASDESAVVFAVSALEEIEKACKCPEAGRVIKEHYTDNPAWAQVRGSLLSADEAFRIITRDNAIIEANQAFQEKDYARAAAILAPHEGELPPLPAKKLAMARKLMKKA